MMVEKNYLLKLSGLEHFTVTPETNFVNIGERTNISGSKVFAADPEDMTEIIGQWVDRGMVKIVGGCCGTTPEHIKKIAERVLK
jgi:5-methyltetrahydrofolate--homocysteine methyltransferase